MTLHIAVLTGKRGGYGAMKPMLHAIKKDNNLKLSLIVTDQHVSKQFGETVKEVEKDFHITSAIDMEQKDGSPVERAKALGVCLHKIAPALQGLSPDVLILYGDRGEVLSTAIAALHLRIPIAHLQGGDISGNVDEMMRHAMTKLSHFHFASTQRSAERIIKMGEEPWRVHTVGDNHIDQIIARQYTKAEVIRERYNISEGTSPVIVLQHPETIDTRNHYQDMQQTLKAVLALKQRTFIVYPCSDQGYEGIIKAIKEVEHLPFVSVYKNIEAHDFWGLLAISAVMVGNSSAGLIETPSFKIPAVNIGKRQQGRQYAENVIHVECKEEAVAGALQKALFDEAFKKIVASCSQPFGEGKAGEKIVSILKGINFKDPKVLNKRMTY